jgi:hypothetical protein
MRLARGGAFLSDENPANPADAPEADAPDVLTDASPDVPVVEEEDPFAPVAEGEPAQFPREYVEKIRREGAKYRTSAKEREQELERLQPLEGVFEGWEAEQVDGFKEFLAGAAENPEGALSSLIRGGLALDRAEATELINAMYAEAGAEEPGAPPADGDTDDDDRPITRRELRELKEAEDAATAQAAALSSVKEEAKQLGYKADAEPGSLDEFRYSRLLHLAAVVHGNDLTKAHEALEAEEQTLIKTRLDALAQEADALPTPTGNGGPGAAVEGVPDWKNTGVRAREFLRTELNR